jgi:hypothetical protein
MPKPQAARDHRGDQGAVAQDQAGPAPPSEQGPSTVAYRMPGRFQGASHDAIGQPVQVGGESVFQGEAHSR